MDPAFWHQKWEDKQIGFHRDAVNPLLLAHFKALALEKGQTIFLPLCGKTLDIAWLLTQGLSVKGIELHEPAVVELFDDLGLEPVIAELGFLKCYSAPGLMIYVGDIFKLTITVLGEVNAVYDRAAIVALPKTMRADYAIQVMALSQKSDQLVINYVYDQSIMAGPPFSVSNEELALYYSEHYSMTLLYENDVEGGLKGCCPATESVWLLNRN
ncbi:MAG: thiopurine S-methyltransferase [Piscirickettsiaceae bacterium]|jgi:thiopurine S-methyltransferase|nr:thiopurine S-methyltransferase [Piscirickettsiaceae bacterium]